MPREPDLLKEGKKVPEKAFAYAGRILRVNLSNKKFVTEETMRYAGKFLGGRGINQWLLYNEVGPSVWPFDPESRLIFGTGVLVGTLAPAACRYTVEGRNPLTGGVGSSNAGGYFGPELKFAGYDHIVIQGRGRQPCYLWIDDGNVEIRNAEHLWGKTTWETDALIMEEIGDEGIQVVTIGPAGENLVRYACIVNNNGRVAGRCGLGAVMGSKNLKAIAVRGSREIDVARPVEFMRLVEELWAKILANENESTRKQIERYRRFGPIGVIERQNEWSGNPVRNFQNGFWDPKKIQSTSKEILEQDYMTRRLACFVCPVGCSCYVKVGGGPFKGFEGEGYKGNTEANFGCRLDVDYLPAIIGLHVLCSQYGLDEDNTAGSIAWAMECYEKGLLTRKDTYGLRLRWDDYDTIIELVRKIVTREDFGYILGEGSARASHVIGKGTERYSMNIKGQELYESVGTHRGWALGVITSPTGGGHLRGAFNYETAQISPAEGEKFFGVPTIGDAKTYDGKAKMVVYTENFKSIVDSLGICMFVTLRSNIHLLNYKDFAELLSAALGKRITVGRLSEMGERIHNVEKAFNVRVGMSRKDDYPPQRFLESTTSNRISEEHLEPAKYESMLDEYYELRGWQVETGLPTKQRLVDLGLGEVAEELERLGRLGSRER